MIVLITGSRNTTDVNFIFDKLDKEIKPDDIIIHGGATGVDSITSAWCKHHNIKFRVVRPIFESKKEYYLYRNCEMIGMCNKVIAFWDNMSTGTKFTIKYARGRGKDLKVYSLPNFH